MDRCDQGERLSRRCGVLRRTPSLTQAKVGERCARRFKDQMRMADLKPGWMVVGNDGRRVGTVREVGQNYLLTSTGFARSIYVPASVIANVENEVVHLSVEQRVVAEMGWEQPPRDDDPLATSPETDLHRHV